MLVSIIDMPTLWNRPCLLGEVLLKIFVTVIPELVTLVVLVVPWMYLSLSTYMCAFEHFAEGNNRIAPLFNLENRMYVGQNLFCLISIDDQSSWDEAYFCIQNNWIGDCMPGHHYQKFYTCPLASPLYNVC